MLISFNSEFAVRYGIEAACIYSYLVNVFPNCDPWYSQSFLNERLCFFKESKIRTGARKLVKAGLAIEKTVVINGETEYYYCLNE